MVESFGPSSLPNPDTLSTTAPPPRRRAPIGGPAVVHQAQKKKSKPAIVLTTRDGDPDVKAAVLEIAAKSDVIDTVVQYKHRRQLGGVTIMSACRFVFNITLCNPISHAPSLTLHGKFNIISITETFLGSLAPSSSSSANSSSSGGFCSFGITLVGQQGHVLGGVVSSNVTAANKVVLVVVTFINPSFHRLPGADLVVHDGGDDHGNPKLGGAGHGGVGAGAGAGASRSEGCSNTSMTISSHGVSSPTPLNSLAPSNVVTWDGSTFLPHHLYYEEKQQQRRNQ
ncbi:hypothetical protein HYC85_023436 [Camellia sinensis]|uniref:PPC domain-containing protein n=1 Tax=Camellia sinensis TaxID=4442 RepID=A0A7J7GFA7_CAMSI|nr:hypothetical protein HYC85_023436 [Camellia sinensis]